MIIRTIVHSDAWCRSAAKTNEANTFSNGCLGSHIDEERSEMRYVMRIAKPVSHQNFERNLHFPRGVCLLECLFIPTPSTTSQRTSRRSGLPVVRLSCGENAGTVHAPRCKTFYESITITAVSPQLGERDVNWITKSVKRVCPKQGNSCDGQVKRVVLVVFLHVGPPIRQEYPLNLSI